MKNNKKGKGIKKHLNYRTLLKVETILSLAFAFLFFSAKITGFAIEDSLNSSITTSGIAFIFLGLLGAVTLLLSKNKVK